MSSFLPFKSHKKRVIIDNPQLGVQGSLPYYSGETTIGGGKTLLCLSTKMAIPEAKKMMPNNTNQMNWYEEVVAEVDVSDVGITQQLSRFALRDSK